MSALGWGDLGNVVPIRGFDKEALKREIPLEWVAAKYGVQLAPDRSGTRLEGNCPFGDHTGPKFTVRVTESGEQVAGCWACPDHWQGDLFELLSWFTGITDFGQILQHAGALQQDFKTDDAWHARPPVVLKPAPKQDPAVFAADAALGIRTAVADPRLIKELIERKARTDPGWLRLTPEFLINSWQVGCEPDRTETRGVSNPDASAQAQHSYVVSGARVLVPHYSWDPQFGWLVRGLKTRNARYGHLIAAPGSDLKDHLYGEWRLTGKDTVLVCEGEGDAWCASAVPEIAAQMDVVSVPTGVKGIPSETLLQPLRGKTVVLAFDGDTDGRHWTQKWVEVLRDVAAAVLVAPVPGNLDLATCPDLLSVVMSAVLAWKPGQEQNADPAPSADPVAVSATAAAGNMSHHADDIANSELFVAQHAQHLRWAPARKMWLVYDGRRWVPDHGDAATRAAMQTSRSLFEIRLERFREGTASESELDALLKRAREAGNRARINAMLELGRAHMVVAEQELDADLWDLNCLNGTLNLKTGQLRPHSPGDLITRLAPVEWDPAARSERWEYFLSTTIPDPEERAFLQRMAGSFLPGELPDERFFVLQGEGGSGKSTFTEALASALGDYATSADVEMFLRSQRPRTAQEANPAMAALVGRRMVLSPEPPKGRQWDEGLLKRLTGGDTMTTREMYGRNFDFKPTFSLVVMANLRTAADGDAGGGMSRRLLEVPFPVPRDEQHRDPAIKAELVDAGVSGSAVLAWAVSGCLEWQRSGLSVPDAVRAATDAYWKEQLEGDPVVGFLQDYYEVTGSREDRIARPRLFEHYSDVTPRSWSRRAFNERMRELGRNLGIGEARIDGYDYYVGLKLRPSPTWDDFKDVAPVTESTI